MKQIGIKMISLGIALSLLLSGCAKPKGDADAAKSAPQSFICAKGKHLMLDGNTIVLKGVNAGGWLLTEDWLTPTSLDGDLGSEHGQYELESVLAQKHGETAAKELWEVYQDNWWTEADFRNIAALGFNLIRLPFGWKDVCTPSGELKADAFERLDWFVEKCEENHLFVILDLHGAFGSQNGRHHSGDTTSGGDLFGNADNEAKTIALWTAVVAHYKDNRRVAGYDLLNEPEGKPDGLTEQAQWDYYQALYKAIRAVDANHLLFLESCWDVNHLPDPQDYGWENVAYEYHYYNWDNGNDLDSMKSYFRYKAKMEFWYNTLRYQVPVFIGEFTFFDNPDCWRYGLDFFEKHEMSWAMWSYKGCVDSNWVLYGGYERTPESIVTPDTDYAAAKAIFESLKTAESFTANEELIEVLKSNLKG